MKIINFKEGRRSIWIYKAINQAYLYVKKYNDVDIILTKYSFFPICKRLFECNSFDNYDNYYCAVEKYIDIVLYYIKKENVSVDMDVCSKMLKKYHSEKSILKKYQKVRRKNTWITE